MLIIGSQAMAHHFPRAGVMPNDTDYIGTMDEFRTWSRGFAKGEISLCKPLSATKMHVRNKHGHNYEFDIAQPGDTNQFLLDYFDVHPSGVTFAPPHVLLALKLSHRYKRNSPHHLKTMRDIKFLRKQGVVIGTELEEWLPTREKETYTYNHPKLDVSKEGFFKDDGVGYKYDHDDLHKVVALKGAPAYTHYLKDGSEVMTCNKKFFSVSEEIRLLGGLEESLVLAAERSLIPFNFEATPEKAFLMALNKVTSSITSGKFREFCWESYDKIVEMYWELDGGMYAEKVKQAIEKGELREYKDN